MNVKFEGIIENLLAKPKEAASIIEAILDEDMPNFFGVCSAKNLPLEIWNSLAVLIFFYH